MTSFIKLGDGKSSTATVYKQFAMRRCRRVFIGLIFVNVLLLLMVIYGDNYKTLLYRLTTKANEPLHIVIISDDKNTVTTQKQTLTSTAEVVQHLTTESYMETSRQLFPLMSATAEISDPKLGEFINTILEEDVRSLLTLARKIGLHLVLIEPCLLWQMLHVDLQKLLSDRSLVDKSITSCDHNSSDKNVRLITFGVMDVELTKLEQLESQLSQKGYLTVSSTYSNRINHLFAKRKNHVIHLPVFNNVSNYLNVTEINDALDIHKLLGVSKYDLPFGTVDQLFDMIQVHLITIQETDALIVAPIGSFLMNLKMSHFIDCNRKLASTSTGEAKKILDNSETAKKMIDLLRQSLTMVYKMSNELLVPLWLDGGTLLGWYRQCGPIDYDHDIDLGTFMRYNKVGDDQYGLTKAIYKWLKSPWSLMETYGFPWLAYQMRMWNMKTKWGVDIFFADEEPSNSSLYTFGYHPWPHVKYCKLDYVREAFDHLCSAVLVGVRVIVPCRPTLVHDHEYGVGEWRHPSKKFRINNGHCRDYYLPEEAPLAFQCLGVYGLQEAKPAAKDVDRSAWTLSEHFKTLANEYFKICQYVKSKKFL